MLTKITIRNFKLFKEVEIPLGNGFVLIGPNNSGKTSALQALTLWHAGLQKLVERHSAKGLQDMLQRPGITVNRLDLIPLPVVEVDSIWFKRKVRKGRNENTQIELIVEGITQGKSWKCGLEFEYASAETLYCRPLRTNTPSVRYEHVNGKKKKVKIPRMEVPEASMEVRVAFLPPMSGLASEEALVQKGQINVLTGQGQTAAVLRNLCYRVYTNENDVNQKNWQSLVCHIKELFGVVINAPKLLSTRGTVTMDYTDADGKTTLDLSSSGRGMQQVLLLLSHLYDNPVNTVFLLDEPDAHLEILRQRQIYNRINEVAEQQQSQIISASHSEVLLNEAAQGNAAVAFVGKPHILGAEKKGHVMKALAEIGFDSYYEAEQTGWILYLEGGSDLKILQAFAKKLEHPVEQYLQKPFVYTVGNVPANARNHFHALAEAKSDLVGFLLLDRSEKNLEKSASLKQVMWKKNEIENYLCNRAAIISYVRKDFSAQDIFGRSVTLDIEAEIEKLESAANTLNRPKPFSDDIKASDDFLVPLFRNFAVAKGTGVSQSLQKKDFYKLVEYIPSEEIDLEVSEVLDGILEVAKKGATSTS
ncbi:MAG: AAA family ATPase [Alphaproteobacteria bacterium]|nr:AAA family ATPase [Alphaproteobacteria bacterium]